MAADIALRRLQCLPKEALVLDPMAGSGTVLRAAASHGLRAIGYDVDPLAVLMARVWTQPLDLARFRACALEVVEQVRRLTRVPHLSWVDEDPETAAFVDYWFGPRQQADLRRLAYLLYTQQGPVTEALRLTLSRIIITKLPGAGASLGADISHSRPHRLLEQSTFDVLAGFSRSAVRLAQVLENSPPPGNVEVALGDARRLRPVPDQLVDAILTSPPYLNAIDYLRGHRLALVWLGHRIGEIRAIRAESVGAERMADSAASHTDRVSELTAGLEGLERLPPRQRGLVSRYALDVDALVRETFRVLRPGGTATFVVGDSNLRGVFIENSSIVKAAARRAGLRFRSQVRRPLAGQRRYLPPPDLARRSHLGHRMAAETIVAFMRP
jgi:tRNA G10  N-methylase Trm11